MKATVNVDLKLGPALAEIIGGSSAQEGQKGYEALLQLIGRLQTTAEVLRYIATAFFTHTLVGTPLFSVHTDGDQIVIDGDDQTITLLHNLKLMQVQKPEVTP